MNKRKKYIMLNIFNQANYPCLCRGCISDRSSILDFPGHPPSSALYKDADSWHILLRRTICAGIFKELK